MDRNKAPNGFKSPLVSVRSTTQILNLFDKKVTNVNDKRTEKSAPESIEKTCTNEETSIEKETGKIVFNVVFGKKSTKKHKTWEGDGLLEVCGNVAVLKGMDGNILGKTRVKGMNLTEGQIISMGNKEIEIIEKASKVSCISNNLCEKESNVEPPQKKMKSIASRSFVPVHSRGMNH